MSFTPGKRLEFEQDVFSDRTPLYIRRAQPRAGIRALRIVAVVVLLAGIGAITGTFVTGAGFFGGEKRSLERMAKTFIVGLASGDGAGALEACAESDRGKRLVQAEEQQVFGRVTAETTANAAEATAALRALRVEMERAGVEWANVKLIAFGGVRARVESDEMKDALTVYTGNIYFESGQRNFSIEVSAWRCGGEHVIVDVWKGAPVEVNESALESHASAQFAEPDVQSTTAPSLEVTFTKQIFVKF
ncbi:MAG TPA: hypothetical protein PLJ47_13015 [Candidatus Hydrogenedentes bacterium]|nr:hypothetical protein [Candidatus Hydrogenedentota bacterium]